MKRLNFDLLYYSLDQWKTLNDQTRKTTGKPLKVRCTDIILFANYGSNSSRLIVVVIEVVAEVVVVVVVVVL